MRTVLIRSAAVTTLALNLLVGCKGPATTPVVTDPPAIDLNESAVALDRDTGIVANDVDVATIMVTVRRTDGSTVAGSPVAVAVSGSANHLSAATTTTGPDGTASVSLRSTMAEIKTVTVQLPDVGTLAATPHVLFVAGPPAHLRFVAQPAAATVNLPFAPAAAVAIEDAQGNRVRNSTATLQLDLQVGSGAGVLTGPTAVAATQGLATFSGVAAAAAAPTVRLAVSGQGLPAVLSAPFAVAPPAGGGGTPPAPVYATLTTDRATAVADGTDQITATLLLRSSDGMQAMSGASVAWSVSGTGNALSTATGTTDYAGAATVDLTATVAEGKTITAVAGNRTFTATVTFTAPPAPVYTTLTTSPSTAVADGTAQITATLTLRSTDGLQALSNTSVAWSVNGTGNTLGATTGTTNYSGTATVTLASTVAEAKTITAVADGRTFTATGTFTPGSASGANSTLTVTAGPTPADGVATASITAVLRDAHANVIPGAAVTVTVGGQGNTLTPSGGTGTTDAAGSFSMTVASTYAGNKAVSASLGGITLAGVAPFAVPVCSGTLTFTNTTTALNQGVFDGVTGDYDNDGHLDLAMISNGTSAVYVMRGHGDGTFDTPVTYAAASGTAIVQGDFTGDNHLDLVAIDQPNNQIVPLINGGTGTFTAGSAAAVGALPFGATVLDADGDGHLDVVAANFSGATISTVRGSGTGTFGTQATTSIPGRPIQPVAADVNGDGNVDLVVANYDNAEVLVLLGDGSGNWAAPVSYALQNDSGWADVRDVDGDGKLDIVATNYTSNSVSVLVGDGAGGFATQVISPAAGGPFGAVIADFNGDGHLDLFYAAQDAGRAVLLPGAGTATFGTAVVYTLHAGGVTPRHLAAGDFNEDGRPDLAVFDMNSTGGVTVMLSAGCTP